MYVLHARSMQVYVDPYIDPRFPNDLFLDMTRAYARHVCPPLVLGFILFVLEVQRYHDDRQYLQCVQR